MKNSKITQDNVYLLLPNKIAHLANRLIKNGIANDMEEALDLVYSSPVYSRLENEKTKYWWLGVNALYHDMMECLN